MLTLPAYVWFLESCSYNLIWSPWNFYFPLPGHLTNFYLCSIRIFGLSLIAYNHVSTSTFWPTEFHNFHCLKNFADFFLLKVMFVLKPQNENTWKTLPYFACGSLKTMALQVRIVATLHSTRYYRPLLSNIFIYFFF